MRGEQLQDMGLREIEEGTIHVYIREQIRPGESLTYRVSGVPSATLPADENSPAWISGNVVIGAAVFILALGILLVWFLRRKPSAVGAPLSREEILDNIIALDNRYAEGNVDETYYLNKRQRLKEKLQQVIDKEKQQA